MTRGRGLLTAVSLSLLLIGQNAQAITIKDAKFAGFAHFEYGKTLDEDMFRFYGEEGEYRDANRVGLRLDMNGHERLSFAAQAVAEGSKEYDPKFEWVYVNLHVNSELDILIGKTQLPVFMYSDFLHVGYAYPWVEPIDAIYSNVPFRSMEGVTLKWVRGFGNVSSELMVWLSDTDEAIKSQTFDSDVELEETKGFSWSIGYDWLTVRASAFESNVSANFARMPGTLGILQLVQGLETASGASGVADAYRWDNDKANFYGLGFIADFDSFFFIGEAIDISSEENIAVGSIESSYLSHGWRLSEWTLSITYSRNHGTVNEDILTKFDQRITAATPAQAATAKGALRSAQTSKSETWQMDVRWDFHPKMAATIQYLVEDKTRVSAGAGPGGGFGQVEQTPDLLRVSLDLVF